jgi:Tol biopolymer transport system component
MKNNSMLPDSGKSQLYLMNPDGSGVTRFTDIEGVSLPDWSPDGTRMVFMVITGKPDPARDYSILADIYVANADGSSPTLVRENTFAGEWVAWSPDGTHIAFEEWAKEIGSVQIYVMNADGSGVTQLTHGPRRATGTFWSPDGTRILFLSLTASDPDHLHIFVMNADGSDITQLGHDPAGEWNMSWSPDGKRILYDNGLGGDIFVMNADGSHVTNLTHSPAEVDEGAAWSPDGARIAFSSDRDSGDVYPDIFVMNADGSNPTRLTFTREGKGYQQIAWSPDGTLMAFESYTADASPDIYVMNADGSGLTNLTHSPEYDYAPKWLPH